MRPLLVLLCVALAAATSTVQCIQTNQKLLDAEAAKGAAPMKWLTRKFCRDYDWFAKLYRDDKARYLEWATQEVKKRDLDFTITHPKLKDCFRKYLVKKQAVENLDFVEAVGNFMTLQGEEQAKSQCDIRDRFMQADEAGLADMFKKKGNQQEQQAALAASQKAQANIPGNERKRVRALLQNDCPPNANTAVDVTIFKSSLVECRKLLLDLVKQFARSEEDSDKKCSTDAMIQNVGQHYITLRNLFCDDEADAYEKRKGQTLNLLRTEVANECNNPEWKLPTMPMDQQPAPDVNPKLKKMVAQDVPVPPRVAVQ